MYLKTKTQHKKIGNFHVSRKTHISKLEDSTHTHVHIKEIKPITRMRSEFNTNPLNTYEDDLIFVN